MIESNFNKDLERKVDLYINGKLDEQEIDDLWAELVQDEYYLDYTKSVVNLKAIIEQGRNKNISSPTKQLRKFANYGVAAAIALIIGVVGILNYSGIESVNNGLQPLSAVPLENYRTVEAEAATDNEIIKEAIQLANEGNTEAAINLLLEAISFDNTAEVYAELSLTLGSIQYNYGEYQDALGNFEAVIGESSIDPLILEKGYWFLGNTYLQLDNLDDAEEAFENTIDLDGQYSRIAERYLRVLRD